MLLAEKNENTDALHITGHADARPATVPVKSWFWRSYLRTAIIPLIFIEFGFLLAYWASTEISYQKNVTAVNRISDHYLSDMAGREAETIAQKMSGIAATTQLFARQARQALDTPHVPTVAERQRHAFSSDGRFYSIKDNGTTASFYSGILPIGPAQLDKVWRLSQLDPLMMDIKKSNPLIGQLYFNSHDSYNRIYPYMDARQYPVKMDIPSYNFYYEADARHNPARKTVWTNAYVDPAGQGWMVSSIAPVWRGDRLEGVVGIDVTLKTVISEIIDMDMPFNAYGVLVDREGRIIALPPQGEKDFGLRELKDYDYQDTVKKDILKPESFNIMLRKDLTGLANAMRASRTGTVQIDLNGKRSVGFSRISGPEWTLLIMAPTAAIEADANRLHDQLVNVGIGMVIVLILFYIAFLAYLWHRALRMTHQLSRPLEEISGLITRIGQGEYLQSYGGSTIGEMDEVGRGLVTMGRKLDQSHATITRQRQKLADILARELKRNDEQHRFVGVMSHEIRTPLAIIDSAAQSMERRAERMTPDNIRTRSAGLRKAVKRINGIIERMLGNLTFAEMPEKEHPYQEAHLATMLREIALRVAPRQQVALDCPDDLSIICYHDMLEDVLEAIVDNAAKFSANAGSIAIAAAQDGGKVRIDVRDNGAGLSAEETPRVFERFYRGGNATAIPGAGMGLYRAHMLIEVMGGKLSFESIPDNGSCVTIILPVHPDDGERH